MRIQITNINTSDSIELEGHEAPILGLSLDPKEEFVVRISLHHFLIFVGKSDILNLKLYISRCLLAQMDLFEYGILRKRELYMFGITLYQNVTPFLLRNRIAHLPSNVQTAVV